MTMTNIQFKDGTTLKVPTLVVSGDLTVSGTTTAESAEQILTKGALTVINSDNKELQATLMGTVIRTGSKDYAIVYEPWNEAVKLGVGTYNTDDNSFEFNEGEGCPIAVRDLGETDDGCLVSWDAERFCLIKSPIKIEDNGVVLNEVSNFYNSDSAAKLYGYYITSIDYDKNLIYVSENKPKNSENEDYYDLSLAYPIEETLIKDNKPDIDTTYQCNANIASNWYKNIALTYKGSNKFQYISLPSEINSSGGLQSEIVKMSAKLSLNERYAEVVHYISIDATANGTNDRNEIFEPIGVEIPLDYRFAFGWKAEAKGSRSFAAGEKTVAQGENSAAFGRASIANKGAFAAGYGNYALGDYSTALGGQNTASESASFAEGNFTEAHAPNAHTEGRGTVVYGHSGHAEGWGSVAGVGAALAKGGLSAEQAAGYFAHAEGNGTVASGNSSHAEGRASKATNITAHAEGWDTTASGERSHSEGSGTFAEGTSSHAEGHQTKATAQGAHSEGMKLDDNHFTTASGKASHAEGIGTVASNEGAHSEGQSTTASGTASHAEGVSTIASGKGAHAEGIKDGTGRSPEAFGTGSHAEGLSTYAYGAGSHAEGSLTEAGNRAHAEGEFTKATGRASHSEGQSTEARGNYSHAGGKGTIASGEAQTAIGKYNKENSNALFIVGNGTGTTENQRSNAFTVEKDQTIIGNSLCLTENTSYGTSVPTTLAAGQIFFVIEE